MEIRDISKENFREIPEIAGNFEGSDDALKNFGKEKVVSLKKIISEINGMIVEREKLSRDIVREGDSIKKDIDSFISDIRGDLSRESEVEKVKGDLRKKKVEISEMQLNEKVSCWKDVAVLKQELREKERELEERESRLKMLQGILDDDVGGRGR